jgi:hypothetical protein
MRHHYCRDADAKYFEVITSTKWEFFRCAWICTYILYQAWAKVLSGLNGLDVVVTEDEAYRRLAAAACARAMDATLNIILKLVFVLYKPQWQKPASSRAC